jgi:hypothetical protein
MAIKTAAGGASHRTGRAPVPPPITPNGWITSRNQQFKMKSDLLRDFSLSLRRP